MTLSAAVKEAYARANTSTTHFYALELRHSTFVAPIRVVNYPVAVIVHHGATAPADPNTDVTYSGSGLVVKEPEINTDPDSTISMQIDNVSGEILPLLDTAMATNESIEATIRPLAYDVSTESVLQVEAMINLQMRHLNGTKTTLAGTFGYTNSANQPFPRDNYTPDSNPGLYG